LESSGCHERESEEQRLAADGGGSGWACDGGQPVDSDAGSCIAVREFLSPAAEVKKPDLDKLVRSVKDALKNVVWADDSQVTFIRAMKAYAVGGDAPRVLVSVEEL
jgi:hypothetical protein